MDERVVVRGIQLAVERGQWPEGRISCTAAPVPGGGGVAYQFSYTHEALFGGNMTPVEQVCRGLIIRHDGVVLAWPMAKFFNLGEPQCPTLPNLPYEVWEKIDGSLGIFWHDGDSWRCNTRGSFNNEYTQYALPEFRLTAPEQWAHPEYTYMFEIIIPNDPMQRAVKKDPGIYMIAMRHRWTGSDVRIPRVFGHTRVADRLPGLTVDDLLEQQQHTEHTEGWVVRFDNGFRVKIKTDWYLRVFRMLQQMTPDHIRDLLVEDSKWAESVPDDLRPQALRIADAIVDRAHELTTRVHRAYGELAGIETRKDFAIAVTNQHPDIARWLFKLRDAKDIVTEIVRTIDVSDLEVE